MFMSKAPSMSLRSPTITMTSVTVGVGTEAAVKAEVATEGVEGVEAERVAVAMAATVKGEVLVAEESPAKEGGTVGGAAEERAVAVESAEGAAAMEEEAKAREEGLHCVLAISG